MRLQINTTEFQDNSVHVEKRNQILGPNRSGKTQLCNLLYEGFSGKKKKNFIWNGNEVGISEYFVYYIKDSDTLDVEKSLGAKSLIKEKVEFALESIDEKEIEEVNNQIFKLVSEIQSGILEKLGLSEGLKMKLSLSLKEVMMKNLKIELNGIGFDKSSYSEKRLGYIRLIMECISNINQPTILIIDEVSNGLSYYEGYKLLKELEAFANSNDVILFVSSSEYYNSMNQLFVFDGKVINDLMNMGNAYEYLALEEKVSVEDLLSLYSENELKQLVDKNGIGERVFEYFLSGFELDVDEYIKAVVNII